MTTSDTANILTYEGPINRPVTMIKIYTEPYPPGYASIKLRGHFKDFDRVEMLLFLEDYQAQIGLAEEDGQKVMYYLNIKQDDIKSAAASLLRGLHKLKLMMPDRLQEARHELQIPDNLPVEQSGFTDRLLARIRRAQIDSSEPREL